MRPGRAATATDSAQKRVSENVVVSSCDATGLEPHLRGMRKLVLHDDLQLVTLTLIRPPPPPPPPTKTS